MRVLILTLLISCNCFAEQYVAGYADSSGAVIGYWYTQDKTTQVAPAGATFFSVPASKFTAPAPAKTDEPVPLFKLNIDTIEARSKAEIDADTLVSSRNKLRRQLYEARELLDSMDEELAISPNNAEMKDDRAAQQSVVDALRKQVNP